MLGDDAALVLGKWHLKRSGGDVGGVLHWFFRHFAEGWRIIHDHTSVQKDAGLIEVTVASNSTRKKKTVNHKYPTPTLFS